MDLINIRRVAWGTETPETAAVISDDLVERLTEQILKRLN